MVLTSEILDALVEEAKKSPRLRMNRDMRTTPNDAFQRMLNAIEPGSVVPVHRHPMSTETVAVLRGAIKESIYEIVEDTLAGDTTVVKRLAVVEEYVVEAGSSCPMFVVPAGVWHKSEALVSGTIIFEAKDGKYGEDGSESL